MKGDIRETLRTMNLGDMQQYRDVAVFPLFCGYKAPVKHLVLSQAMEKGLITIGEVGITPARLIQSEIRDSKLQILSRPAPQVLISSNPLTSKYIRRSITT